MCSRLWEIPLFVMVFLPSLVVSPSRKGRARKEVQMPLPSRKLCSRDDQLYTIVLSVDTMRVLESFVSLLSSLDVRTACTAAAAAAAAAVSVQERGHQARTLSADTTAQAQQRGKETKPIKAYNMRIDFTKSTLT